MIEQGHTPHATEITLAEGELGPVELPVTDRCS